MYDRLRIRDDWKSDIEPKHQWGKAHFSLSHKPFPMTQAWIDAISPRLCDGYVYFKSFEMPNHPWLSSPNLDRLTQRHFLEFFWSCSGVREVIHDFGAYEYGGDLTGHFFAGNEFTLPGEMAYRLWDGCYGPIGPPPSRAMCMKLSTNAANELLDSAQEDENTVPSYLIFVSTEAWAEYFQEDFLSHTWLILNFEHRLIHLLATTASY